MGSLQKEFEGQITNRSMSWCGTTVLSSAAVVITEACCCIQDIIWSTVNEKKTDFRDLRLWKLCCIFAWSWRPDWSSSKWRTFWLRCFQSSANQRLHFIFHRQTYFFFLEILYVEKPPETAWKNFQVVQSDLKWSKAIWSALKHFPKMLNFPSSFEPPFYSHSNFLIFSSATFFFVKFSMSKNRLKPLETAWKNF